VGDATVVAVANVVELVGAVVAVDAGGGTTGAGLRGGGGGGGAVALPRNPFH